MRRPWLDPDEQREVVEFLLATNVLKFSNKRDLPLKMGGTTDIYNKLGSVDILADAVGYFAA